MTQRERLDMISQRLWDSLSPLARWSALGLGYRPPPPRGARSS